MDEIVINDCGNLTQAEMSIERLPQICCCPGSYPEENVKHLPILTI